jgi:flagellar secretion chaperone FliS
MLQKNPWQSYRQVATQTASPGQLVLMLYDGAIRFLERARQGFASDDPLEFNQTINNNILRAQAIVHELDLALDIDQGGDLAVNLRRLYHYMDRRLQEANQYKKEDGIVEILRRLTVLRNAWAEMLQKQGAGQDATFSLPATG